MYTDVASAANVMMVDYAALDNLGDIPTNWLAPEPNTMAPAQARPGVRANSSRAVRP